MITKVGLGLVFIPTFGPYVGFVESAGEVSYVHSSDSDGRRVTVECKPGRPRTSHVQHQHTVELVDGAVVGKTIRDGEVMVECRIAADHPLFEAATRIVTAPEQYTPMPRM